jgi:hypothetical protein
VAFERTSPEWLSNLSAGWENEKWSVDGFVHYTSKFNSYNGNVLEPVGSFTQVAGRVARRIKGFELALTGQNLLHERESQAKGPSGLQAERRAIFSISKSW